MSDYKMLDLCAGLGGASEAMLNHGWDVLRIENNPVVANITPNTQIMDVQTLHDIIRKQIWAGHVPDQPTFVWASPPCTDFSTGYSSPRSIAQREGIDYYPQEAIDTVLICKAIIDQVQPRYWAIENVRGSIKYLEPFLGTPTMIIDSIVIWGVFPKFSMDTDFKHIKPDAWSDNPLRANIRAKIPYQISNQFRLAIENTRTLDYWMQ